MANKRILILQDLIESLCRSGSKYRVIGCKGDFVLVEEQAPEETDEAEVSEETELEG